MKQTHAQTRELASARSAQAMLSDAIAACPINALPSAIVDGLRNRSDISDGDLSMIGNNVGRLPREKMWERRNG